MGIAGLHFPVDQTAVEVPVKPGAIGQGCLVVQELTCTVDADISPAGDNHRFVEGVDLDLTADSSEVDGGDDVAHRVVEVVGLQLSRGRRCRTKGLLAKIKGP